ncbi:helix-turn-helix domain-containing protein [Microbacterium lacticum]
MDAAERWRVLRLHVEDQIPLAVLARETGISARTLQRWHQLYRAGGIAALEPHDRNDKGGAPNISGDCRVHRTIGADPATPKHRHLAPARLRGGGSSRTAGAELRDRPPDRPGTRSGPCHAGT